MSPRTPATRPVRRRPSSPLRAVAAGAWWTLLLLLVPACAGAAWRLPVAGEVVERFRFSATAPYAGGQHRGVKLAARPGAVVVAPCGGSVTFAGRAPGRGRGVTIACGAYAATVLELATTRVESGTAVRTGSSIGTARADRVHLGARRRGARHGYVDPLALVDGAPTSTPPVAPAAPLGRAPRPAPAPAPRPLPTAQPAPAAARAATPGTPLAAWLGLVLLLAAVPTGALAHRRRSAALERAEAAA